MSRPRIKLYVFKEDPIFCCEGQQYWQSGTTEAYGDLLTKC